MRSGGIQDTLPKSFGDVRKFQHKVETIMRCGLACYIVLSWVVAACPAGEPAESKPKPEAVSPAILLQEASELALKQDEHQHYWTDRVLLHIGEVQIRAGDFTGALRSIRSSSYSYGRNAGLHRLAEALARAGKRERAFDVLHQLDSYHGLRQNPWNDGVQLRWIEYLIASGELGRAGKAIDQLKSEEHRPEGLRKLAVGYAKSGDAGRASELFARALNAAATLQEERYRCRALSETAAAQLSFGKADAAKAAIHRLAEKIEFKDPWVKSSALRESAVLMARANDEQTAHDFFRRALGAQKAVDALNEYNALKHLSVAQASVGYIADALKTASMIKHDEKDFRRDSEREEALCAIAAAQLKANDVDGAIRTAMSIEHFLQYRDDAIHKIVEHLILKRDLKTALTTAEKATNPSRKASAMLKVAAAYAQSGDRKKATEVAARIKLTQRDYGIGLPVAGKTTGFDYRFPRSWGVTYDVGLASTMLSIRMANNRAAEVAKTAMALSQGLGRSRQNHTQNCSMKSSRERSLWSSPGRTLLWVM